MCTEMNGADLPTLTRRFWLDWGRFRSGIAFCSSQYVALRRRWCLADIAARVPLRDSTSPSTRE